MEHLWDVKHNYYCSGDTGDMFKSFAEFLAEWGEAEEDYNLLFRFDWNEDPEEGRAFNGDEYYRNAKLKLFYMHQRKGNVSEVTVDVCRADEPAVIEYLKPLYAYLVNLWQPMELPK